MSDPVAVVYDAIERVLGSHTECVWAGRVYADRAPAKKERPYVVFFLVSESDLSQVQQIDPMVVVTVKCVAESRAEAFAGKAEIAALLDDSGEQETAVDAVAGDTDWEISTVSRDRGIWLPERLRETVTVYHAGNQYEFVLGMR